MKRIYITAAKLRAEGSCFVETLDDKGNTTSVTRYTLLHVGDEGRDVIEVRTETNQSKSEHRVEVGK